MAKLMKCTKCPFHIDVTSIPPGSVIECPNCNVPVRVPTGQTGKYAAVPAGKPVAKAKTGTGRQPAVKSGGRQTALFRKMSHADPVRSGSRDLAGPRSQGSNTGLILGICAVVLVAVVVGILVASNGFKPAPQPPRTADDTAYDPGVSNTSATSGPNSATQKPSSRSGGDPNVDYVERGGKPYPVSKTFKGGARNFSMPPKGKEFEIDENAAKEVDRLLKQGSAQTIFDKHYDWMPIILDRILSEDETMARTALQVMDLVCEKYRIKDESTDQIYKFDWAFFNEPKTRAGVYDMFCSWFKNNKWAMDEVRAGRDPGEIREAAVDPKDVNWDEWMKDLKYFSSAGYLSDDYDYKEDSPGYPKWKMLRAMGSSAYPYLAKYIDNENVQWGKAAVVCLRLLSGKKDLPMPKNPEQAKQVKQDIVKTLGIKE